MSNSPPSLKLSPARGPVSGTVRVPGSKSYTNRALLIAGLADGESLLTGVLDSEDTEVMRDSLHRLGLRVEHDASARTTRVEGKGAAFPARSAELFLANSGTSIRFLTAAVALGHGEYRLDGIERMRQRPIGDLIAGLRQLGVDVRAELGNDCPPLVVRADGLRAGKVQVRGDVSSQFLSALLMAAPLADGPVLIQVVGELVSKPYVDMTLAVMREFGVAGDREGYSHFFFPGGSRYQSRLYAVEPDASAASYFFGAAAVVGGKVTVEGLGSSSLQGDLRFVRFLERMGCKVEQTADRTTVVGGPLKGIDADLCHESDTVPTLAAVACFADSPTTIRNVAHIRHKETDRIAAVATELRKTGIRVDEFSDGLTIHPIAHPHGASFATYNDHRMAMSLALLGLRIPGVEILDPGCTRKTYPEFFQDLARLTQ